MTASGTCPIFEFYANSLANEVQNYSSVTISDSIFEHNIAFDNAVASIFIDTSDK